ncbi:acyltransferase family protein [Frigoribacterium sp. VKM Ac-2836]|uniref:acyltransferase family protein n=1 Tax=Frigoribacterium sp. VKM Ac-2836 TaxID=2739014 RepID=UPI001564499F|nr:acyltransferase family protein [Frigoribacterium sp. VKM Ac-2836]NRD27442.1 acyltransferase [Frigoribacterium sp. VKM Ac-2836]
MSSEDRKHIIVTTISPPRRTEAVSGAGAAARAPGPPRSLRLDVQALRALAVTMVVVEHVTGRPAGGFVGVDVFFVVSGFLITGLLLREAEGHGRVSILDFWRRRIRRIVPASVVVLLVGTVVTWLAIGRARGASAAVDALWSVASLANWHFAAVGTDYFAAQGPESPFQHYWSLAVEEQFYLVWPLVVVAAVAVAARRGRPVPRVTMGVLLAIVAAASFAVAWRQSTAMPTVAYFSSIARAWELALGALLATASPLVGRLPAALRPVLSWAGLGGVVASAWITTTAVPFPAPGALLPVIATLLVLVAGTGSTGTPWLGPVASRPVTIVGDLSYSIYLWHFVVLVIGTSLLGDKPTKLWPAVFAITLALSALSYHLIERPFIASPLLERGSARHAWRRWRREHRRTYRRGGVALLAVAALTATGLAADAVQPTAVPPVPPPAAADGRPGDGSEGDGNDAGGSDGTDGPDVPALDEWSTEVARALSATSWPDLDPDIESVLDGTSGGSPRLACGDAEAKGLTQDECTWTSPSATTTVMLVGDSTAMHELDALTPLAEAPDGGFTLVNRAKFACPFVDIRVQNDVAGIIDSCRAHNDETLALIEGTHPDVVLVTNSYQEMSEDGSGPVTPDRWAEGFGAYARRVAEATGSVVLLTPPPDDADIASCFRRGGSPVDCISRTSPTWLDRAAADRTVLEAVGGTFVDLRRLTCVDDLCPAFVGDVPVKQDRVHLTMAFAVAVSPVLGELLRARGVL